MKDTNTLFEAAKRMAIIFLTVIIGLVITACPTEPDDNNSPIPESVTFISEDTEGNHLQP